jgi:predicted nuclease of predicted toxin-antitoxin system
VPFLLDNDMPDMVARVLVAAGHEVLLRNVLPKKSVDSAVFDYATANALLLITCNRDDFVPLASTRAHSGLIILIRRRSRILESAKLLQLLESAGDSGLAGNINFA